MIATSNAVTTSSEPRSRRMFRLGLTRRRSLRRDECALAGDAGDRFRTRPPPRISSRRPSNRFLRLRRTIQISRRTRISWSLQNELTDTEDKIQAARRFYNGMVSDLNVKVQVFPTNVFAGMLGFTKMDFFGDLYGRGASAGGSKILGIRIDSDKQVSSKLVSPGL